MGQHDAVVRSGSKGPSFASRWRGQFRAAERADTRYDQLARKYLQ